MTARLCLIAAVTLLPAIGHADDWYLLEFTAHRPHCGASDDGSEPPAAGRCWETSSKVSRFEIRDGEALELPAGGAVPPSWVIVGDLLACAPALAPPTLAITVDRTPSGLRLQLHSAEVQLIETLPLGQWVPLQNGTGPRFWARATAY